MYYLVCCVLLVERDSDEYSAVKISSEWPTWEQYNITGSNYLVQPSVVRPVEGKSFLIAYMRDRRAMYIYNSTSSDDGKLMAYSCHVTVI